MILKKRLVKLVAIVTVVAMIVTMLPVMAFAETDGANATSDVETQMTDEEMDRNAVPKAGAIPDTEMTDEEMDRNAVPKAGADNDSNVIGDESGYVEYPLTDEAELYRIGDTFDFGDGAEVMSFDGTVTEASGEMIVCYDGYGANDDGVYVGILMVPTEEDSTQEPVEVKIPLVNLEVFNDEAYTNLNAMLVQGVIPAGVKVGAHGVNDDSEWYEFRVIYDCELRYDVNGGVTADRTLVANAETAEFLSIFEGIPVLTSAMRAIGSETPTKSGATFAGWYAVPNDDDYAAEYAYFTEVKDVMNYVAVDGDGDDFSQQCYMDLIAHWTDNSVAAVSHRSQVFAIGDTIDFMDGLGEDDAYVFIEDANETYYVAEGKPTLMKVVPMARYLDTPGYYAAIFSANVWETRNGIEINGTFIEYPDKENPPLESEITGIFAESGDGTVENPYVYQLTKQEICRVTIMDETLTTLAVWNVFKGDRLGDEAFAVPDEVYGQTTWYTDYERTQKFDISQPVTEDLVLYPEVARQRVWSSIVSNMTGVESEMFETIAAAQAYYTGVTDDMELVVTELEVMALAPYSGQEISPYVESMVSGEANKQYRYVQLDANKYITFDNGARVEEGIYQMMNPFDLAIPLEELNIARADATDVFVVRRSDEANDEHEVTDFTRLDYEPNVFDLADGFSYYDRENHVLHVYTNVVRGQLAIVAVDRTVHAVNYADELYDANWINYIVDGGKLDLAEDGEVNADGVRLLGWFDVTTGAKVQDGSAVTTDLWLMAVWAPATDESSNSSSSGGRSSSGRSSGGSASSSAGSASSSGSGSSGSSGSSSSGADGSSGLSAGSGDEYNDGSGLNGGSGAGAGSDYNDGTGYANFRDVPATAWYAQAVAEVVAKGWMNGTGDGNFAPQTTLNRGMLATILYRMAGQGESINTTTLFTDVDAGSYYATPVAWCYGSGVVNGYDATSFAPDGKVTREQLVVMLARLAGYLDYYEVYDESGYGSEGSLGGYNSGGSGYGSSSDGSGYGNSAIVVANFADAGEISDYAVDAVNWAVSNGIVEGRDDGSFAPKAEVTRAECAALVLRFAERIAG